MLLLLSDNEIWHFWWVTFVDIVRHYGWVKPIGWLGRCIKSNSNRDNCSSGYYVFRLYLCPVLHLCVLCSVMQCSVLRVVRWTVSVLVLTCRLLVTTVFSKMTIFVSNAGKGNDGPNKYFCHIIKNTNKYRNKILIVLYRLCFSLYGKCPCIMSFWGCDMMILLVRIFRVLCMQTVSKHLLQMDQKYM